MGMKMTMKFVLTALLSVNTIDVLAIQLDQSDVGKYIKFQDGDRGRPEQEVEILQVETNPLPPGWKAAVCSNKQPYYFKTGGGPKVARDTMTFTRPLDRVLVKLSGEEWPWYKAYAPDMVGKPIRSIWISQSYVTQRSGKQQPERPTLYKSESLMDLEKAAELERQKHNVRECPNKACKGGRVLVDLRLRPKCKVCRGIGRVMDCPKQDSHPETC